MNGLKIKTTHIAEIRRQQATQMDEVCALIGWDAERYCNHQFEQYQRFCAMLAGKDRELRRRLEYSAVFRGFWNNEWAMRNKREFLPFAHDCSKGIQWIFEEYTFTHSADRLVQDESFSQRFEQIFKSIP